jgi:quercetin dioxygenase-like cupin family protein
MSPPGKRGSQRRSGGKVSRQRIAKPSAAPPAPAGIDDAVLEPMLLALEPVELPLARKLALEGAILDRVRRGAVAGEIHYRNTITVRAGGDDWIELVPGVRMKRLHRDGDARTFLLRLEPGAALPVHHHEGDEECIVVEGEVFLGDLRVAAGDYHLALSGTVHESIRSPRGALLFIRSASGMADPS